ncbi:Glycosyltransferase involved in cell wall bisynthesis [Actinopolymorpha cephalotaxi]|uniref:Glycosyltransferase involved in cell wall biosynthesis n=1 Tax=Actinopolymorpha cephalotaxi TaxID=504797 RepID=A0A1I2WNA4_9ACTN|nr:glycosyltransferase [Actinopolymorpha cephalotaxi]NYH85042.1 glycosyltransferase involved in cell wall biosynthesis [Actinopolymorpha cephalotaxi]SFH02662.1 Glycosyltransferase involved in cell wall bisynthesis [Actinopolymorpha cephalotaxi]
MKVLVYPHAMELGGSQLNAVELAGAVRELGHQVTVISEPGPLVQRVVDIGLEHLELPAERRRPSPTTVRLLRSLITERGFDVVHGYEWPPGVEAYFAAGRCRDVAATCTVMSMSVAPFLPADLSLAVGTAQIRLSVLEQRFQRRGGGRHSGRGFDPALVNLLEPPVDLAANRPGHPADGFRAQHGLDDPADTGLLDVVVVCRLVPELKLEGVLTAVHVIGELARELPLRLVVVGDGPAREQVEARAAAANKRAGRRAVVLTGALDDPRPAYAAASITLGMGGSALRALAFGQPLIVQGEDGFFELLTRESSRRFLRQGWYGLGGDGAATLARILRELATDEARRKDLADFGLHLVTERFSLEGAALLQEAIYLDALERAATGRPRAAREAARTIGGVVTHKVRRRRDRRRGTAAADDFNQLRDRGSRR